MQTRRFVLRNAAVQVVFFSQMCSSCCHSLSLLCWWHELVSQTHCGPFLLTQWPLQHSESVGLLISYDAPFVVLTNRKPLFQG